MDRIFAFKASGGGCRVSGRVCAQDIQDATNQVVSIISGYGPMNTNISELKNQPLALKQWAEKQNKKSA